MSGGHAHGLFVHEDSPVHRLPPQCKVAALLLFVVFVVATPREAVTAYAIYVLLIVGVARAASVPLRHLTTKLVFEVPFLAFALFLPFVGQGERVEVLGLSLSAEGLWAAWNILIKATLAFAATLILAATTSIAQVLHGLEHLKMPRVITAIAGFMVRYVDVVTGEATRMKNARESRGYVPRSLLQSRALASSFGVLFIRAYERGERIYKAMIARGFTGSLPMVTHPSASIREWGLALLVPALVLTIAAASWIQA